MSAERERDAQALMGAFAILCVELREQLCGEVIFEQRPKEVRE